MLKINYINNCFISISKYYVKRNMCDKINGVLRYLKLSKENN